MNGIIEPNSNNQANPTMIWQSLWAELFRQTLDQMNRGQYHMAFKSLLDLKELLPFECANDVTEIYKEGEKLIFKTKVTGCSISSAERDLRLLLNEKAPPMIRRIIGAVTRSLYTRNWINKDFSAKPKEQRPQGKL